MSLDSGRINPEGKLDCKITIDSFQVLFYLSEDGNAHLGYSMAQLCIRYIISMNVGYALCRYSEMNFGQ